jgi:hypothetical protein
MRTTGGGVEECFIDVSVKVLRNVSDRHSIHRPHSSGNENLRLSVLFFIIVMGSGSLKRSCARALIIAWLHIIRPAHLCLVYGREIVGLNLIAKTSQRDFSPLCKGLLKKLKLLNEEKDKFVDLITSIRNSIHNNGLYVPRGVAIGLSGIIRSIGLSGIIRFFISMIINL